MATQTLIEAAKLIQDDLVRGVAQDIIDIDPMFTVLPFDSFTGQSVTVNRELALGDAAFYNVGDTIISKNPSTTTPVTFFPTSIIGDAEVNGLVQATSGSAGVDQMRVEIQSKAKNVGRLFRNGMVAGTGVQPDVNSLSTLVDPLQTITSTGITGANLVDDLELLVSKVLAKDGEVDFIVAPFKVISRYRSYLRQLGGTIPEYVMGNKNRLVTHFNGIPMFQNDFVPTNLGVGLNETEVFAGTFDDGSRKVGIAGIHPEGNAGIRVQMLGAKENTDDELARVKWYTNLASFNRKGLAKLGGIL